MINRLVVVVAAACSLVVSEGCSNRAGLFPVSGKVLYKGHAVAAIAATNIHIAEEAAKRVKVEYEVLPSVTWVLDAMKPDAPILHDDLRTDEMGKKGEQPTNVQVRMLFEKGKPEEDPAFSKDADWLVEHLIKPKWVVSIRLD